MGRSGSSFGHHFLKKRIENLWVFLVGKVPEIRDTHGTSEGQFILN